MREIEALYIDKGLNKGYIFLDDPKKAKKMKQQFIDMRIRHTTFIIQNKQNMYFGFKFFGMRKNLLNLAAAVKEIVK